MAAELRRLETGPWFRGRGAFSVGEPALDRFPLSVWSSLVARHARRADPALLPYGDSMGLAALREAVAEYLRTARAVRCEPDQIMIVNGSQQALELAARVLLDAESPVWIEEPGYFGLHRVLTLAGARLVPVPVDDEGLDVAAAIARSPKPRAVFVTPSHQFPLGVTMSASRRLQLLDWARESGAWIVEDDYDSEYRYGNLPIAALQGLDRDARVIYIGTFTKILFPALRLGYLVLPPDLVYAFTQVRYAMDILSPTFFQAVLADFIREGHFARHIRRMRRPLPRAARGARRCARARAAGRDARSRRRRRNVPDGDAATRPTRPRDLAAGGRAQSLGGASLGRLCRAPGAAGPDPRLREHARGADRGRRRAPARSHPVDRAEREAGRPQAAGRRRASSAWRNRLAPSRSPTISQTFAATSKLLEVGTRRVISSRSALNSAPRPPAA